MSITIFPFGVRAGLLLVAMVFNATCVLTPAGMASPVSQAWAVQQVAPSGTYLQSAGMDVAPSGDVYLVAQLRRFGADHDILITRRSSAGAVVWQKRYPTQEAPFGDEMATAIVADD